MRKGVFLNKSLQLQLSFLCLAPSVQPRRSAAGVHNYKLAPNTKYGRFGLTHQFDADGKILIVYVSEKEFSF